MYVYFVSYRTGQNFNQAHRDGPFHDRSHAEQCAVAHAGQGHTRIVIVEESADSDDLLEG